MQKKNGTATFLPDGSLYLHEQIANKTREPWLMLLARRGQDNSTTLCWGINNSGASFARIGTQEGDLVNGFVHEDPYKTRLLGQYLYIVDEEGDAFSNSWYPILHKEQELETTFQFGSLTQKTAYKDIAVTTRSFIPTAFDGLIQLVSLKNNSEKPKKITLFAVNPVNIGDARNIQFSGFNSLMLGGSFLTKNSMVQCGAIIMEFRMTVKALPPKKTKKIPKVCLENFSCILQVKKF